jgi:anti-anti-sigma factor
MKLTLLSSDPNLVHILCSGEINYEELPTGSEPLQQILGADCYSKKVLLNLEKAPHIDSVGVGWLVRCHRNFKDAGGLLILHSARPAVRQVFEILNLTSILNIADHEEAARTRAQSSNSVS